MTSRYVLLKHNWGIIIFLDMEAYVDSNLLDSDISISKKIFFRIDDSIQYDLRKKIKKYFVAGLRDIKEQIEQQLDNFICCYYLRRVDYNEAHFQDEGLYCAVQDWVSKYYNIHVEPINAEFDISLNRYVFEFPPKSDLSFESD